MTFMYEVHNWGIYIPSVQVVQSQDAPRRRDHQLKTQYLENPAKGRHKLNSACWCIFIIYSHDPVSIFEDYGQYPIGNIVQGMNVSEAAVVIG